MKNWKEFPEETLITLDEVIGSKKKGIRGIIPISKSTWYLGISQGIYPKAKKIGARRTAWRLSDVLNCVNRFEDAA